MRVNIDATTSLLQACAEQSLLVPEVAEGGCMDSELQPPLTSIWFVNVHNCGRTTVSMYWRRQRFTCANFVDTRIRRAWNEQTERANDVILYQAPGTTTSHNTFQLEMVFSLLTMLKNQQIKTFTLYATMGKITNKRTKKTNSNCKFHRKLKDSPKCWQRFVERLGNTPVTCFQSTWTQLSARNHGTQKVETGSILTFGRRSLQWIWGSAHVDDPPDDQPDDQRCLQRNQKPLPWCAVV